EIVALTPQQATVPAKAKKHDRHEKGETVAKAPRPVETQPVAKPVEENQHAQAEPELSIEKAEVQQPVQRASNDPRQKRRQQREAAQAKAATPKIRPSQVPTLNQYSVGSLIRHVYGD
ncbi:ribonuclease E/G, partial [Acinetobacter baumannii]